MTTPLVSIVTPVYNGEVYLRECIESVLSQTYGNWRYTIVDNCSTDHSREIVEEYSGRDSRIRLVNEKEFLAVIDNHNRAFGYIDSDAKYCKPLMADDWLFPECIERMVAAAEFSESIGLVCCYAFDGTNVLWDGLPYPGHLVRGTEVCRQSLLGKFYVFGSPSSMLLRADLIRHRQQFYNPVNLHADVESCYDILQESNFGFVHQVLVFNRIHEQSETSSASKMDSVYVGALYALFRYGRVFLSEREFEQRFGERFDTYYRLLARGLLRVRDPEYWKYHEHKLRLMNRSFSRAKLGWALLCEIAKQLTMPVEAARSIRRWWS